MKYGALSWLQEFYIATFFFFTRNFDQAGQLPPRLIRIFAKTG